MLERLEWIKENIKDPRVKEKLNSWNHFLPPLVCDNNRKILRFDRRGGKTLVLILLGLYEIYTKPRTSVLFLSAANSMKEWTFATTWEMINESSYLRERVVRRLKNELIEVESGGGRRSQIMFLNSSRRSEVGANTRGREFNLYLVDDLDLMAERRVREIVLPGLMTIPATKVVFSLSDSEKVNETFHFNYSKFDFTRVLDDA